MVLQNNEKCYSHACCTSYEVKRKTKSASVSKTSMPNFNGGGRRKKLRKMNSDKCKPIMSPRTTKNRAVIKHRKNQRVGRVISGAPFLTSDWDVDNHRTSHKFKLSPQSCRGLRSSSRNLQDASTQTLKLSSAKSIFNHSNSNYFPAAENEGIVDCFAETSPLKGQENRFRSSKVSSQKRGSGDSTIGRCNSVEMKKLDICCFPLININPYELESGDGYGNDDSKVCIEKDESFLENEKDSLIAYIYQAQEKVNDIRMKLEQLAQTLTSSMNTPVSPRDTKHAKQLQKALDNMIKEVDVVSEMGRNWSVLSATSPCRSASLGSPTIGHSPKLGCSPITMRAEMHANGAGDTSGRSCLDQIKTKSKSRNYAETPKRVRVTPETTALKERSKLYRKVRSPRPPSAESLSSSIGKESSLTLLKKELGSFFEKMKQETDLLMEDAQMHHKALLHYSEHNSISSFDISSTDSTGL